MIMAIFAMSLDLLVGYTGLVSLGHAAFFGLAGYVLAFAAPQYQAANLWLSLPLAMACSALLALVIGVLVLRTSGIYFIMVTLAFRADAVSSFSRHQDRRRLRRHLHLQQAGGGHRRLGPVTLESHTHFYFVVLVLLALVYLPRCACCSPRSSAA